MPAAVLIGTVFAGAGAAGAATSPRATKTLWVAPTAKVKGESVACSTAKYHAVNRAINAAAVGDTVQVCAGTYTGSASVKVQSQGKTITITSGALIEKKINLVGMPGAIINAKGLVNGVTIYSPGAAGATVNGITAEGAIGEGILAVGTSGITIENSTVKHNDNGSSKSAWIECQASGPIPNDCGEGLHLLTVTGSTVKNNTSEFNSGGMLLSDEFGPTSHNTIKGNLVEDNESDCGITIVGHNAGAVNSKGVPQPKVAGVYDNLVTANMVISNGTTGEGGGILLAGVASYDNTITDNEIAGNGLAGVTIHEHGLNYLSGDVIAGNWIGTNDITGDPGTPDQSTTGVFVERDLAKFPIIKITIKGNTIAWDAIGIYDVAGASGLTEGGNTFIHVKKDVKG